MTKAQAIKRLVKLGCSDIVADGKYCVWATPPSGVRGLFDPRELLAELERKAQQQDEEIVSANLRWNNGPLFS